MKLFGVSLQRNGAIENNTFKNSVIWTDGTGAEEGTQYFYFFPVEIPSGTGSWFSNVTTEQVDAAGYTIFTGAFDKYFNQTAVPDFKYGYDPLWNVIDPAGYTWKDKTTGNTYTIPANEATFGIPKLQSAIDAVGAKIDCRLQSRLLAIYNDSSDTVTVKVRISDQSFKGAVTELTTWELLNDPYQLFSTTDDQITTETDGANNSPANAKFKFTRQTLGNTLPYVPEEITVTLAPDQWKIALLTMYVTKENGNYAGVDDDYMILSTETL
jgi:hypothetical protein